ncbi:MAG: hypothetical protein PHF50_03160 [Patescibacteria group bacterium]|nr:hypothetical protein [Patescibacteria group bacterium]
MSDKLSKKELDDVLAHLRKDREHNIYYTAPLGYFWRQGVKRRDAMINQLVKILRQRGHLSESEEKEILSMEPFAKLYA